MTRKVSIDELNGRYRKERNSRVKERLLAMLHLHEGKTIREVSKIIKRSERSIGRWAKCWNECGYDGLLPQFDGGPKPKLADSEWDKIVKEIENKGMTLRDVAVYVKDTRGVHYAYKGVWGGGVEEKEACSIRQGLQDEQKEARQRGRDFKKRLNETLSEIREIYGDGEPLVGFLDESSLRVDPSRRRVLNTPVIEYSEGKGKRSRTIFGFMNDP